MIYIRNLNNYENAAKNYLSLTCSIFNGTNVGQTYEAVKDTENNIRLTIIDLDGNVVFDSENSEVDENHLDRPEVINLNTVVNRLNYNEKFTNKIKNLDISRWKIMKLKVFDNGKFNNRDLSINNEQFNYFLENNPHKNAVAESSMVNSYLMVDANGNLVDNASDNYKTIGNVYAEKFETLYKKYNIFNHNLYAERY